MRELASTRRSKKCRSRGSILIALVLPRPSVHVSSSHTSTKLTTVTDVRMDRTKWCDQRGVANALSRKHIGRSETVLVPFLCSACGARAFDPRTAKRFDKRRDHTSLSPASARAAVAQEHGLTRLGLGTAVRANTATCRLALLLPVQELLASALCR